MNSHRLSRRRSIIITAAFALTGIGLIILGIQWSSWDYDMMTGLDYRKNSQIIMRHDPTDLQEYLNGIRQMLTNSGVNIIEDHRTGNFTWEIVGRSGKRWLTSSYLDKITIVGELTKPEDTAQALQRQFVVYGVSSETGSRAFISIVVLCLMIIATLSLKDKYLPRISTDTGPSNRKGKDDASSRFDSGRALQGFGVLSKYGILIFAIALVLRIVFLVAMLTQIGSEHIIDQYPDPIKYVTAADFLFGQSQTGLSELYIVGVGYPSFVGVCTTIFGHIYWPILVIQIILGSLSCVIIYMIAGLLTGNRTIALLAGVLSAVSLTSISLANAVLTETLFFFLLALSLYLLFKGLRENRWWVMASAGILGGLMVLVRSAGMFLPLLFVFSGFVVPRAGATARRKQLVIKSLVAVLIMIIIPAMWGLRNLKVHDTYAVSGTGILAAKTYLTASVLVRTQDRHVAEFTSLRDSLYRASLANFEAGKYRQDYEESRDVIITTLKENPGPFIRKYLLTVSDNITATSGLHYIQLPQFSKFFETVDNTVNRGKNNPWPLVFALVGFVVVARREWRIALILLSIMVYFAALSGVTFGQGSRIFFPAQVAQSILISTTLLFLYNLAASVVRFLLPKR